jgi:hypothetical protein
MSRRHLKRQMISMPEGVVTPDGKPVDADPAAETEQAFARAMSEPQGDDKAPPKRAERKPEPSSERPRVKRSPARPRASQKPSEPVPGLSKAERVEGVKGLVQLGAVGVSLVGQRVPEPQKTAFLADAVTLSVSSDQLAEAVADTCDKDPRLARVIDRVCSAGPYGALVIAAFTVGKQIARNHGVNMPGTHAPEDLVAYQAQQEAEMAAAA